MGTNAEAEKVMVEVTKSTIRVPVKRVRCAKGSFRIKTFSAAKGIKGLLCCPVGKFSRNKCQNGMKLVTVLYSRSKWSPAKAKAHAARRFK